MKTKRTRLSLSLTPPYLEHLDILIEKGIFMERQTAIREFIRDGFKKYGLESFGDLSQEVERSRKTSLLSPDTPPG